MVIVVAALVALPLAASFGAIVRRLRPATLMTFALVSTCFSGNWDQLGLPLGPDRVLFLGALISLLLRGEFDVRLFGRRHLPLLLLGVYGVCSLAAGGTLTDPASFFALLDGLGLAPFIAFVLAPMMYRSTQDLRTLRTALVVMAAYLGMTAVFEMVGPSALVFPRYIVDESVGIHFGRARGPFTSAAPMGLALTLGAAVAVLAAHHAVSATMRVLHACVAAIAAIGVVLTLTRANWLGAMLAAGTVAVMHPAARRVAAKALPMALAVVTAAVLLLPGLEAQVTERSGDARPLWDRLNTNAAAVEIIEHHPLFGAGFQRFRTVAAEYVEQHPDYPLTTDDIDVHNLILALGAELGLVGITLFCWAFATCVIRTLSLRRHPAVDDWRLVTVAFAIAWVTSAMFAPTAFALPNLALWLVSGIVDGLPRYFHGGSAPVRRDAPAVVAPP